MKTKNILIALILFLSFFVQTNASVLSLSERHGPSGSVLQVPLTYKDAEKVAGAELLIQYDPTLLEFIDVSVSTFTKDFVIDSKSKDDKVAVSIAGAAGLEQTKGTLFYLNFRIKLSAQTGTSTELTILSYRLYDENGTLLETEAEHGVVKVSDIVVYPNPITPNNDGFNDFATFVIPDSITGDVKVTLFSLTGNKIAEIFKNESAFLQWDGLDDKGRQLRPGPYLYFVQSEKKTLAKGTITIMH